MKNIARRFLVVMLTLVAGLSCIGCTEGSAQTNTNAPDYSDSTLQMDFYGYSPPTDGTYNLDVKPLQRARIIELPHVMKNTWIAA